MIRERLSNGMSVVIENRTQTELAVVNILYKVGSAHEKPGKTGMAHLLEHLMFEGSKKFPNFDKTIHALSGENNAYTTNDYTNYYEIIPAGNIETVLAIEADRMNFLQISQKKFLNQQQVVIEEFKESHLNMPYGMHWHYLCELMYPGHHYQWPVIGDSIEDIRSFELKEINEFYHAFYNPSNVVVSVVGAIDEHQVMLYIQKYFGGIPSGPMANSVSPMNIEAVRKQKTMIEPVPQDQLYMAMLTPPRFDTTFYSMDLLSDILSNGQSSRLYKRLYKEEKLFSDIDSYVTANIGQGLLIIEGKMNEGISCEQGFEAIKRELQELITIPIPSDELQKVKNKAESYCIYSNYQLSNRAANLALFEAFDLVENLLVEHQSYLQVTENQIQDSLIDYYSNGVIGELEYRNS